jgi:hypothetical protein
MKYDPADNVLSNKAKKNKKDSETKSYFNNTHEVFVPSWVKYKNPSLKSEEDEDEDDEKSRPKGKALLKRIYGGGAPCWKGYEQFGMKEKDGRQVPNCIPKKRGGKNPCNCELDKVVDNYQDVINHLEEHQAEGVGDPMDKKQAKELKKDIKRVNALHLVEANKIRKSDPLYKVSNPKEVQRKAKALYGKDAIVYKSTNPKKKYQIQDKKTGKFIQFGQMSPAMEDFTKHRDLQRQKSYLSRATKIKGNWRENIYSPNTLSIMLLW